MGFMSGKSNTDAIERYDGNANAVDAGNGGEKALRADNEPTIQDNAADNSSDQSIEPSTKKHMKTYMGLSGRKLNIAISVVATNGFLLFGFDQGVMSGIITDPVFNDYFPATKDNSTAECSKSSNRGLLICIEGATIAFGTMIAYWINYGSQFSNNESVHWRWPIAFQIVFGLFLSVVMVFLPESPRWLLSRERYEEGE
ncbi:hypothetical protein VF21_10453, partial [Pseudogymnoascus sp. 05NY08]